MCADTYLVCKIYLYSNNFVQIYRFIVKIISVYLYVKVLNYDFKRT